MASGECTQADFEKIQAEMEELVRNDYDRAELADEPNAEDLMKDCWGELTAPQAPPIDLGPQTMVDSINKVFHKALENDPNVIFFGEDIEDPKGGFFGHQITRPPESATYKPRSEW